MMKVKITRDTIVRMPAGTVVDVPDDEGKRLIAFGNAKKEVKKDTKKGGK